MPMPFLSVPQYPAVGHFPGVPNLIRLATAQLPLPVAALADAVGIGAMFGEQWGLFPQGSGAPIVGDSVVAFGYARDYEVSDYPIELGGFTSYNKVAQPYSVHLEITIGMGNNQFLGAIDGTSIRREFLAALDAAEASTDLYYAITPERTYQNLNVVHASYRRSARSGVSLIHVDVWCQEIRLAPAPASPASPQSPNGATPSQGGWVSAAPIPVTATPLPPPT